MRELKSEINGLNYHYELLLDKAEVDAKVVEKLMEIRKNVKMAGFRPGHVPIEIIAKNYGFSAKKDAVIGLVKYAVSKLISDKKVRPAFQPEANIISDGEEGLKLSVKFDIIPDFELKEFKNLEIKRYSVKIDQSEIDKFLSEVIDRHAKWIEQTADYKAKEGDKVVADIKLLSGNSKDKKDIHNVEIVLRDGEFIEDFWKNLVNLGINEWKEFSVGEGKDSSKYRVKISKIFIGERFKLDDEFAKFLGLNSKDEINKWASDVLQREYDPERNDLIKKQLLDVLTKMYNFDIPQSMVSLEEREIMRQIELEAKKEGKELSQKKMPKIKEECNEVAVRRVRLGLVIAKVAVEKKITVTSEELRGAIMAIARLYPGKESEVMKQYMRDAGLLSAVAGPLLEEKVVRFILSNYAKVTEIELSKEEFQELDNEYFDCYDDEISEKGIRKLSAMQQKLEDDEDDKFLGGDPIAPTITGLDENLERNDVIEEPLPAPAPAPKKTAKKSTSSKTSTEAKSAKPAKKCVRKKKEEK